MTLFGAGMWTIKDYGTTFEALAHDAQKMTDMCVAEAARIRSDVVYVGSGFNNFHASALGKAFGVGIKYREMGAPDMTTHFVNSEEDLAKLNIADVHKDPVVQTVLEATRRVKEKIGDTYLVTMTCWGPFTLAARMVGEEHVHEGHLQEAGLCREDGRFLRRPADPSLRAAGARRPSNASASPTRPPRAI